MMFKMYSVIQSELLTVRKFKIVLVNLDRRIFSLSFIKYDVLCKCGCGL